VPKSSARAGILTSHIFSSHRHLTSPRDPSIQSFPICVSRLATFSLSTIYNSGSSFDSPEGGSCVLWIPILARRCHEQLRVQVIAVRLRCGGKALPSMRKILSSFTFFTFLLIRECLLTTPNGRVSASYT
jgi:hypothetical protein